MQFQTISFSFSCFAGRSALLWSNPTSEAVLRSRLILVVAFENDFTVSCNPNGDFVARTFLWLRHGSIRRHYIACSHVGPARTSDSMYCGVIHSKLSDIMEWNTRQAGLKFHAASVLKLPFDGVAHCPLRCSVRMHLILAVQAHSGAAHGVSRPLQLQSLYVGDDTQCCCAN